MRKLSIFLFLLHIGCSNLFAQKETFVWYFGDSLGLDFKTTAPQLLTNGKIFRDNLNNDRESSSTISDADGNILFYTDGVTVWNKLGESMPNGTGLWGSGTTTQTIIVPLPGSKTLFYIFTASPQGDDIYFPVDKKGFRYSIVDLSMDEGYGDVIEKNVLLVKSTTEKVAATIHANERDVWVVMHEWNSNVFRSFLVTDLGISEKSIVSAVGSMHDKKAYVGEVLYANDVIGQMKISPNGEKLALTKYISNVAELFDFNNATGRVYNPLKISGLGESYHNLYGVEFSSSSDFLYLSDGSAYIYQVDISNLPSLRKTLIGSTLPAIAQPSSLQLGPDGKIYVAQRDYTYIGVIHFPNAAGVDCGYVSDAISTFVNGKPYFCNSGLPNFISSYFLDKELYPPKPYIEMPNVFTPNGDGYNDSFLPIDYNNLEKAKLNIFNRWGERIFETEDITLGWSGKGFPSGIYYWHLVYWGKSKKTYDQNGFVQLIKM